jgi:hypothetical protein
MEAALVEGSMGRRSGLRVGLAALTAGFLAACGGTSVGGDSPAGSFEGSTVTARAAVVTADVDGDGRADLVGLPREGRGDAKCWRNRGDGTYGEASASWGASPAVRAMRADAEVRDDASLESDLGVHRADCPERSDLPYARLHLGDGAGAPLEPPTLEAIRPESGDARSLVFLEGRALAAQGEATTVAFGGVPAQVPFAFPDVVLAVVPDGLPLGPVTVTLSRGGTAAGSVSFTVEAPAVPFVESVEPTTLAPGAVAVVSGDRLGTPLDEVTVTFSGVASSAVLALEEVLFAVVPENAVSGPLVVTVGGVASAPFDVVVGTLPAPAVTALVPAAASPGSLVRIEGTDLAVLGDRTSVSFDGIPAALFGVATGAVTAIVPPGASDGPVVVTVGGRASAGTAFDVVARGTPTITAISPAEATPGSLVEVEGTDLHDLSAWRPGALPPLPPFGDLRVVFSGKPAWLLWPTVRGVRALVPQGAPAGSGSVTVEHSGQTSAPFPFTVN